MAEAVTEIKTLTVEQASNILLGHLAIPQLMNAAIEAIESQAPEELKLKEHKERVKDQLNQQVKPKILAASAQYERVRKSSFEGLGYADFERMSTKEKRQRITDFIIEPLLQIANENPKYSDTFGLGKLILACAEEPQAVPAARQLLEKFGVNAGNLVTTVNKAITNFRTSQTASLSKAA
ncbi:MAG: hypothetical protein BWY24_00856 [Microgenomates group bacterium ADurb.Bin219]|nr:MAG: hypothetical protein BWY24_00856 [Microgenomates group bacterium ADurb.Bin219]HNP89461.1 hypothetical protein [Candidatus Woesebacteria bacterium]